jgi:hypothetical protein
MNWLALRDPNHFLPRSYPIQREVSGLDAADCLGGGLPQMRKMRRFWAKNWAERHKLRMKLTKLLWPNRRK